MSEEPRNAATRQPGRRNGPLAGIRILDFGWVAVGPLATRLLADMGAEVIKVEDRRHLDLTRRLPVYKGQPPRPFSDEDANPNPDKSGLFNNYNRNKLGITIDMSSGKGRALAESLVKKCDVVSENYAPGVMEKWGLTYERLKSLREDIIYVRMSGFGHEGPYWTYRSYGPIAQAVSGLTHASGLPGREPSGIGFAYMDNMTGYFGSSAILMAILRRKQTGRGAMVSLAAMEVGLQLLGPLLLDATSNGRITRRPDFPSGNRHPWGEAAPHGVYPCKGEDRWCAIAVFGDEEWARFSGAIGGPKWTEASEFCSHASRLANQDALDGCVAQWTHDQDPYAVTEELQRHGIAAAPVQTCRDLQERDPQVRFRRTFFTMDHPVAGEALFEGVPLRFSRTPPDHWRSSPCIGEDNGYVLGEVLGRSPGEIRRLEEEGII